MAGICSHIIVIIQVGAESAANKKGDVPHSQLAIPQKANCETSPSMHIYREVCQRPSRQGLKTGYIEIQ